MQIIPYETNQLVVVPALGTVDQEIDAIHRDSKLSGLLRETVYYRIYRIHRDRLWETYVNPDTGQNDYDTFESFVQDTISSLNLGRQTIFNRIKIYQEMIWLGYDDNTAIQRIAEKPDLYRNVLNLCVDWDVRAKKLNTIRLPNLTGATEGEAKAYILGIIDNADSFDTQLDAIEYVKDDLLHEPRIDMWIDPMSQIITVQYQTQSVDQNGKAHIDDAGTVKMYPDRELPSWVMDKLKQKIR